MCKDCIECLVLCRAPHVGFFEAVENGFEEGYVISSLWTVECTFGFLRCHDEAQWLSLLQ